MDSNIKPLPQQQQQDSKLHFLDYWRIIRIRKTIILTVFLLILLTTIGVTYYLPASYSATARMRVEKDTPDIGLFGGLTSPQQQYDPFWLLTEFEVIQSSKILYPVIERLELQKDYAKRLKSDSPLSIKDTFEMLSRDVDVKQFRNTSILEVRAFAPTAAGAAELANTVAEVYKESRDSSRNARAIRGIGALSNQIAQMKVDVDTARRQVDMLARTLNVPDIIKEASVSQTPAAAKIAQLEQLKTETQVRLTTDEELYRRMTSKKGDDLIMFLSHAASSPELTTLVAKRNDARQQLSILRQDYGPQHPNVQRVEKAADTVEKQISDQVQGILETQKTKVDTSRSIVGNLSNQLAEVILNSNLETERLRPYSEAKRNLDEKMRLFTALNVKKWQEQMDSFISKADSVEIIQPAEAARRPVRPNKPLNIALGTLVGLMVGVGLAFFIEYLDTSVKTIDDVEQALQAPVLGVIPQNVSNILKEGPDSAHAEAYRVLRTNVLFSRKDPSLRTVTVVSGGAGEGKSTTIFNLAATFAQQGDRVLVVDSDLRRPSLHKIMNVTNSIGLTNYLLGQNKLEEVVHTTPQVNFDFLPSGKLPSSSMGILNSNKMKEFIQEVKRRYDFVFFDSPPIMGVSDASVLASEVDMSILVVQYRKYPQQMTLRAKQMVEKVGGRLLGVVLNNINISQDSYYYYYSGYYYDYYSKSEESKTVEKKGAAAKPGAPAGDSKGSLDLKQKY